MRKNTIARQVRRAYSQDKLARICTLREDRFGRAFGLETIKTGKTSRYWGSSDRPEDYYHFRDNGSRVLAVAHLDTVVRGDRRTPRFRDTERGPLIVSGALDDRLGAYVILDLLPKLGITCDWLLTVGEESGQSTAESFKPGKDYDWLIEFDRAGTDVVMYQYEDRASRQLVEAAGARMGQGSFSDVAYLEHLDVKGFNWGVGYGGNYHSEKGYAYLDDTFTMVAKYLRFHEQNAGTRMPHEPYAGYGRAGRHDEDEYFRCDSCGEKAVDSVTWYCTFCGLCADCGAVNPDVAADWNDPDADVCQCYTPGQRGAGHPDDRDWRTMGWDDYCALRPALRDLLLARVDAQDKDGLVARESARRAAAYQDPDDSTCDDCGKDAVDECTCNLDRAHAEAQDRDGPGPLVRRSPSIAPPWSASRQLANSIATLRQPVSYGLGVPTSRKIGNQSGDLLTAVHDYGTRLREERDQLTARFGQARSAVNPPAVFPDADQGWHEAAGSSVMDGLPVVAHKPGQSWARICLRCAARWPHPVSGDVDIHPEADCPGCDRCLVTPATGAIHVIPAHLAGESDTCTRCRAQQAVTRVLNEQADALSEADRDDPERATLRALDEQEVTSS